MSQQDGFYLQKRKTRDPKRNVYYVQFIGEDGKLGTAISTHETSKEKAKGWAKKRIEKGSVEQPTLRAFAGRFFDWTSSPWIKRQLAKGRRFSEPVARSRQGHLDNYILDHFGEWELADIDQKSVEEWLAGLELSGQSKNHILNTFRIVLREAKFAGYVRHNVLADAEAFGANPRTRDTITLAELHALFPEDGEELIKIWLDNERAVAFLLLASTGIRGGECRALRWLNVLEGRALYVDCGLDAFNRPKGTKTGATRVALLPARAQAMLEEWRELAKWKADGDFIFSVHQDEPHGRNWLTRALPGAIARLNDAAEKEGLPPVIETAGRNLVVHSFRHTFISLVRNVAPDEIAKAMSGHATDRALDIYTHRDAAALLARLEPSRQLVEKLWKDEDNMGKMRPGT